VPEAGLEPALPCGKGILRPERRGDGSTFCRAVALFHYEGYGQRPYFTRVMDTQVDTWGTQISGRVPDACGKLPPFVSCRITAKRRIHDEANATRG
jgi:hypothetical protein